MQRIYYLFIYDVDIYIGTVNVFRYAVDGWYKGISTEYNHAVKTKNNITASLWRSQGVGMDVDAPPGIFFFIKKYIKCALYVSDFHKICSWHIVLFYIFRYCMLIRRLMTTIENMRIKLHVIFLNIELKHSPKKNL